MSTGSCLKKQVSDAFWPLSDIRTEPQYFKFCSGKAVCRDVRTDVMCSIILLEL